MEPSELPVALGWAAAEGWRPGLDDAEAFFAADARGFFVAELEGKAIATISVVNHDSQMAFLGLYICRPEYRGRGLGLALWSHALAHAGARTIGLDGVPAQQQNYARSGFRQTGSTMRWEGVLTGREQADIRPAGPEDRAAIARLDRAANGYARTAFLDAWTRQSPGRRTLLIEAGGTIAGFATVRRCQQGCKIGPLIAPDAGMAADLVLAAQHALPGELLILDIPQTNHRLINWLEARGFACSFQTARMYRGEAPTASQLLQSVGTLELG